MHGKSCISDMQWEKRAHACAVHGECMYMYMKQWLVRNLQNTNVKELLYHLNITTFMYGYLNVATFKNI